MVRVGTQGAWCLRLPRTGGNGCEGRRSTVFYQRDSPRSTPSRILRPTCGVSRASPRVHVGVEVCGAISDECTHRRPILAGGEADCVHTCFHNKLAAALARGALCSVFPYAFSLLPVDLGNAPPLPPVVRSPQPSTSPQIPCSCFVGINSTLDPKHGCKEGFTTPNHVHAGLLAPLTNRQQRDQPP